MHTQTDTRGSEWRINALIMPYIKQTNAKVHNPITLTVNGET